MRGGTGPTEWPASPQEWRARRVGMSPTEWRKTTGRTARECEGGSSCRRALTPLEWTSCPEGGKTPEWPLRLKE